MKKRDKIVISIFVMIFLLIDISVRNISSGILFDRFILDAIHKDSNPVLLSLMKFISFIGSSSFLIPLMLVAIIYTLYKKEHQTLKLLMTSTLGSYALNFILKIIFSRTRPLDYFLVDQGGLSYPSGHSMVNMTFYMTLAYIANKNLKDQNKKKWIYGFAFIAVLLMGISRLYLGVHWPTDVIGGYLIGYVFFYMTIKLLEK